MVEPDRPIAIHALEAPHRQKESNYPEPFRSRVIGREKRPLGDIFGLVNFGVNLTRLSPGAVSALMHRHGRQDEFVYVLKGEPTLATDRGPVELQPGMCAGFPAQGLAHHLINHTREEVVYLEIGDRSAGDTVTYPRDDLVAVLNPAGVWTFKHKDGRPY